MDKQRRQIGISNNKYDDISKSLRYSKWLNYEQRDWHRILLTANSNFLNNYESKPKNKLYGQKEKYVLIVIEWS